MTPLAVLKKALPFMEDLANSSDNESEREIANQMQEVIEAGGWQPIETAPRDGTPIIVGVADADYYAQSAWFDKRSENWLICATPRPIALIVMPTHWMPLPEPPAAKEQAA